MPYIPYFKEHLTNIHILPTDDPRFLYLDTVRADDDEVLVSSIFQNGFNYPEAVRDRVNKLMDEHGEEFKDFFQGLKTKVIPVHKIVPTQPFLSASKLNKKYDKETEDMPEFVFYKGRYFLIDGHHRIANKIKKGGQLKGVVYFMKDWRHE